MAVTLSTMPPIKTKVARAGVYSSDFKYDIQRPVSSIDDLCHVLSKDILTVKNYTLSDYYSDLERFDKWFYVYNGIPKYEYLCSLITRFTASGTLDLPSLLNQSIIINSQLRKSVQ